MKKQPKIIILQDYFLYKGGGERLVITLAKALGADMATAFITPEAFNPRDYNIKTKELVKKSYFSHLPGVRHLLVQFSFFFKTKFLKDYDIVIYSGDCVSAVYKALGKKNIAYLHTPPRHLYDNYKLRLSQYGFCKRQLFRVFVFFNRIRFQGAIKKMDKIVANSQTVQKRIKKYLGLDSQVVYPPCAVNKFKWLGQKDYYFSYARLYDVKRVDKIVRAFTQMPQKKLIVASGGPELKKIKKIAQNFSNIKILNWVSEEELLDLLGNCLATIYLPINEDFGMSPVESMSAGKPVIGVAEGGLQETIINQKTGLLIKSSFTIQDIIGAVKKLDKEKAQAMRSDCEERAQKFSEEKFIKEMQKIIFN